MGLAFWFGLAFQLDWIFPQYFQGAWSELLGNAMTVGGLTVIAGSEGDAAVLEFIASTDETNLEDRMALLSERAESGLMEQEVSLRLLRHYASSVRHSQYHDTDVITVRVESAYAL